MSAPVPNLDALKVGDELPAFETPALTRHTLALYCGASGDHNPIHVDIDFAHAAGMPDVFAHGMLSMAWLGRLLTRWVPQSALREFSVRFVAMTQVGERIRCAGRITEKFDRQGEPCVRLALSTTNAEAEVKLLGEAVVALGRPQREIREQRGARLPVNPPEVAAQATGLLEPMPGVHGRLVVDDTVPGFAPAEDALAAPPDTPIEDDSAGVDRLGGRGATGDPGEAFETPEASAAGVRVIKGQLGI